MNRKRVISIRTMKITQVLLSLCTFVHYAVLLRLGTNCKTLECCFLKNNTLITAAYLDVNVSKPIVDLHFSVHCANGLPGKRELFDMRNLSPIVWTVRGSRLRPKFPRILITYCHHILIATLVLLTLSNSSFQPVAFYHVYISFVFYCYTYMYV